MQLTPQERTELANLARTNRAVRKLLRRNVQLQMIANEIFDIGIYPLAVIENGCETPRTPWQDGHNAAVLTATGIIAKRFRIT